MAQRATCLDSPPRLPETERVTEMIELDPTKCFPGKWRAIQISNVSLFIDPIFRGENLVEFKPPLSEDCRIRRVRRRVAGCGWLSVAFRVGCGWLALAGGDWG